MYGYQQQFAPQYAPQYGRVRPLAQTADVPVVSTGMSPGMKAAATVLTLGVAGAAAWVGIREGVKGKGTLKVAGYVGGIGAGLLGLATLVNLVSPDTAKTIMMPFRLPAA